MTTLWKGNGVKSNLRAARAKLNCWILCLCLKYSYVQGFLGKLKAMQIKHNIYKSMLVTGQNGDIESCSVFKKNQLN